MKTLAELLEISAVSHKHLCPRQVLGVRMGLWAGRLLELEAPCKDKRLLSISETDGCFVDGLSAATGCQVGRRTLRIEDYGKVAATFVDTQIEQALRIVPRAEARILAWEYAAEAPNAWQAQRLGYQRMPDDLLFTAQWVQLAVSLESLLGRPGQHTVCQVCGEEIINQREVEFGGMVCCRACAGQAYYEARDLCFNLG